MADASHELRTPLSILLSSVDLINDDERNRMIIADLKGEILHMRHLVNSLLELARSDSGKEELAFTDFDLSDISQKSQS